MMAVSKDEIKKIAGLAHLRFSESEIENLQDDMNRVLTYMEKLNELDTENVEPLSHPNEMANVFREDELKQSIPNEEALKNAPEKENKFFKVPKVIPNKK